MLILIGFVTISVTHIVENSLLHQFAQLLLEIRLISNYYLFPFNKIIAILRSLVWSLY